MPAAHAQLDADSETESAAPTGDVIYRKDARGKWQPFPVGQEQLPSIREMLQRGTTPAADIPDSFISKLSINGQVVDGWAALDVRLEIHSIVKDRWLRIPLQLDQGLLLTYSYEGEGESAPASSSANESGIVWMLRGEGRHILNLSLRVPVRRTTSGSQLQLLLPKRSEFFGGEMTLQLPPGVIIEPNDTLHVLEQSAGEQAGHIKTLLASDRIDLRWSPIVEESSPITRATTRSTLLRRDDRIRYSARQEIRMRSAGLDHVDIRLPSEVFRLQMPVRLSEPNASEREVQIEPAENDGWVRVPLDGVHGTLIRLDWLFEMPFDDSTHDLTIDGLEIAGAEEQSGTISIEGFDQHILTRRPDAVEGVTRIGVDELPAAGAFANLAYLFQTGKYRLVLDVDRMESTYRVTPIYVLDLTDSSARLSARYLMSIDEGRVDALPLVWPDFVEQDWTVDPVSLDGGEVRRDEVGESAVASQESGGAGAAPAAARWLLKPSSSLVNRSYAGLSAVRPLTIVDNRAVLPISLPGAAGVRSLPAVLIVKTADDVEATVHPMAGTKMDAVHDVPERVASLFSKLADNVHGVFELRPQEGNGQLKIDVSMQTRDMRVDARSIVTVEDIDTAPQVRQRFEMNVTYGRIPSLTLQVPGEILEEIQTEFRDVALPIRLNGQRLPSIWRNDEVQITFPEAMRGDFQIEVGPYVFPALKQSETALHVPVIRIKEHPTDSLRLVVPQNSAASLSVSGDRWTHLTTVASGTEWITRESPQQIRIELDHSLQRSPQQAVIPSGWIRSQTDDGGTTRVVAQYELSDELQQLAVRLPADSQAQQFDWNGKELQAAAITQIADKAGQYLLELPARSKSGWLRISYALSGMPLGWCRSRLTQFPSFGQDVVVERTLWDLGLPMTHHLFLQPTGMSPQFTWQRSGLVWRRTAAPSTQRLQAEWVERGAAPPEPAEAGNHYLFETLGSVREARVRLMSNSMLVFLGAGTTLLLSFLVLQVPAARNLWVWLTVGTFVAIGALWNLNAVLLMLQPAVYGLILPLLALLFDRLTGRRPDVSETLSGRSFQLTLPGGEESDSAVLSNHEAVPSTLVRPSALSDSGVS